MCCMGWNLVDNGKFCLVDVGMDMQQQKDKTFGKKGTLLTAWSRISHTA